MSNICLQRCYISSILVLIGLTSHVFWNQSSIACPRSHPLRISCGLPSNYRALAQFYWSEYQFFLRISRIVPVKSAHFTGHRWIATHRPARMIEIRERLIAKRLVSNIFLTTSTSLIECRLRAHNNWLREMWLLAHLSRKDHITLTDVHYESSLHTESHYIDWKMLYIHRNPHRVPLAGVDIKAEKIQSSFHDWH